MYFATYAPLRGQYSRLTSAIRPPPSSPILAPFALLCGQPFVATPPPSVLRCPSSDLRRQSSALCRPPSAVPSDSCAFCASLRPTLRRHAVCRPSSFAPPSSVLRCPSSDFRRPIRFLRFLRFFAANPPSSHPILAPFAPLCGQPSVAAPPPSAVRLPIAVICARTRAAPLLPHVGDRTPKDWTPTAGKGHPRKGAPRPRLRSIVCP
jgi:hypothetical protein